MEACASGQLHVGQFLPAGDAGRDQSICVIGAAIQRELFPGRSALGEMLRLGDARFRVIGVHSARGTSLGMDLDEVVIIPIARHMRMFNLTSLFRVLVEMNAQDELPAAQRAVVACCSAARR